MQRGEIGDGWPTRPGQSRAGAERGCDKGSPRERKCRCAHPGLPLHHGPVPGSCTAGCPWPAPNNIIPRSHRLAQQFPAVLADDDLSLGDLHGASWQLANRRTFGQSCLRSMWPAERCFHCFHGLCCGKLPKKAQKFGFLSKSRVPPRRRARLGETMAEPTRLEFGRLLSCPCLLVRK